jgi:hypothetical protein
MTTPQKSGDDEPKTAELDTAELHSDEEGVDEEASPIHDQLASTSTDGSVTTTTTVTTDVTQNPQKDSGDAEDSEDSEDEEEDTEELTAPETAKAYKVDVQRALERETADGKGDEDPGPSDWNGYATEGVEEEEDV